MDPGSSATRTADWTGKQVSSFSTHIRDDNNALSFASYPICGRLKSTDTKMQRLMIGIPSFAGMIKPRRLTALLLSHVNTEPTNAVPQTTMELLSMFHY